MIFMTIDNTKLRMVPGFSRKLSVYTRLYPSIHKQSISFGLIRNIFNFKTKHCNMERLCLDCQQPIIGRTDKKFCDDQCRTNYNNRLKSQDNSSLKEINQILKKNYLVLKDCNPEGKTKIKKDLLLQKGFNFGYHTHIYTTQKGVSYTFCYDYGYLVLDNENILLVKRENK